MDGILAKYQAGQQEQGGSRGCPFAPPSPAPGTPARSGPAAGTCPAVPGATGSGSPAGTAAPDEFEAARRQLYSWEGVPLAFRQMVAGELASQVAQLGLVPRPSLGAASAAGGGRRASAKPLAFLDHAWGQLAPLAQVRGATGMVGRCQSLVLQFAYELLAGSTEACVLPGCEGQALCLPSAPHEGPPDQPPCCPGAPTPPAVPCLARGGRAVRAGQPRLGRHVWPGGAAGKAATGLRCVAPFCHETTCSEFELQRLQFHPVCDPAVTSTVAAPCGLPAGRGAHPRAAGPARRRRRLHRAVWQQQPRAGVAPAVRLHGPPPRALRRQRRACSRAWRQWGARACWSGGAADPCADERV